MSPRADLMWPCLTRTCSASVAPARRTPSISERNSCVGAIVVPVVRSCAIRIQRATLVEKTARVGAYLIL
jgi:hypothetical protein